MKSFDARQTSEMLPGYSGASYDLGVYGLPRLEPTPICKTDRELLLLTTLVLELMQVILNPP